MSDIPTDRDSGTPPVPLRRALTPAGSPAAGRDGEPVDVDVILDRAVAGVPCWRRRRTRRELAAYVEDAFADLLTEGMDAAEALDLLREQFGNPETVAAGFRALPPPRWARGARASAGPLSAAVLGLVLGLALLQTNAPAGRDPLVRSPTDGASTGEASLQTQMALLRVQEVSELREPAAAAPAGEVGDHRVAARLGVTAFAPRVLEPSVPALTPDWLPDGYNAARGELFLTSSATVQFFADERGERPGIVVEVLRPDRSTVFQVKEQHVFPLWVGELPALYIDGEWEVRGPLDEQPAPAAWRTDRSHSLLLARDDLLVLVAGPADILGVEDLAHIARSLR